MGVFFNRQSVLLWVPIVCTIPADLYIFLYEADFIQWILKKQKAKTKIKEAIVKSY
jgi:hypothetical protein